MYYTNEATRAENPTAHTFSERRAEPRREVVAALHLHTHRLLHMYRLPTPRARLVDRSSRLARKGPPRRHHAAAGRCSTSARAGSGRRRAFTRDERRRDRGAATATARRGARAALASATGRGATPGGPRHRARRLGGRRSARSEPPPSACSPLVAGATAARRARGPGRSASARASVRSAGDLWQGHDGDGSGGAAGLAASAGRGDGGGGRGGDAVARRVRRGGREESHIGAFKRATKSASERPALTESSVEIGLRSEIVLFLFWGA